MRRAKAVLLATGTMSVLGAAAWTQQLMFSPRQKPSPAVPMTSTDGQEQAMDYNQALALQQQGKFSGQGGSAVGPGSNAVPAQNEGAAPVGVDPDGNPVFGAVPEPSSRPAQNEAEQSAQAYRNGSAPQEYAPAPEDERIGGYSTQMPQGNGAPVSPQVGTPQARGYNQPNYNQPSYNSPSYNQPANGQPGYAQPGYAQRGYGEPYTEPVAPQQAYGTTPSVQGYGYGEPTPQVVQGPPVGLGQPQPVYPAYPPAPVIAYNDFAPYPYAYGPGVSIVGGVGPYYRRAYPVAPFAGRPYPLARSPYAGHVPLGAGPVYAAGRGYAGGPRGGFAPYVRAYGGAPHGGFTSMRAGYAGGRAYAGGGRGFGGGYARGGGHGRGR